MGLFGKKESWEEKQAKKLQKLRKTRLKEEGRAKLKAAESKERTRIRKARGTTGGSSFLGRLGGAYYGLGVATGHISPKKRRVTKRKAKRRKPRRRTSKKKARKVVYYY